MNYLILITEESKPVLVPAPDKSKYIPDYDSGEKYNRVLKEAISDKSKHIQFKDEAQAWDLVYLKHCKYNGECSTMTCHCMNEGTTVDLPENINVGFEDEMQPRQKLNNATEGAVTKTVAILSKLEEEKPSTWEDMEREYAANPVRLESKFEKGSDYCPLNDRPQLKTPKVVAPSEEVKQVFTDKQRIDWLEKIMTPDDRFCEIYFAGLRDFKTGRASSFQIESNPDIIKYQQAPTLREAIDLAIKNEKF